ncbi:cellulose binding domain-containing protein [Streptomyces sp. BYX5S]
MRRPRTRLLAAAVLALAAGLLTPPAAQAADDAKVRVAADTYTWKNARIDGGGFVPGIVFNRSEKNLAYARTDIGGAYRWQQETKSWTPLLDSVGWDDWGHTGVASIATDSVDPDRVYAAVGTYTNDWDPGNGAILRSADRGATWNKTDLPFKLGGNMPGRGMGERLAVDPHDNDVLYLGAPSGKGLWRSTDAGVTWSQVTAFPNAGTYVPDPSDTSGYSSDRAGVVWVTFDESSASGTDRTKTLYVGVADKENSVYRSTDAGVSWERVGGGQPTGFVPHKGVLDAENGYLYVAYSDTGGPYDGAKGQVWRYATKTGEWKNISPAADADTYYGYSGLTIDRQHPGTVMVSGYSSWWPDTLVFRSTDSGGTWTKAWDYSSYPTRENRYTMDVSSVPWLTWGANPTPPEQSPKLGWMTEALEIDPFDSDRMMYGTGATIYGTEGLTKWDAGEKFTITPMVKGLEETAVNDLVSPPSGAPLLSALGDVGGFRHTDLTKVPSMMFTSPNFTTSTSLDFAESKPDVVVRSGNVDSGAHVAISNDNGANWHASGADPSGVTGGGTVAVSADGARFVWSPDGAGVQTGTGGAWTASTGVPAGATVESDRADPSVFYAFKSGTFYVSSDGGSTFTAKASTGLPTDGPVRFKAVPGAKGDIWLAGGSTQGTYGLWHSKDGGATFSKVSGIEQADTIGFGKAAQGATYQTLYASAKIGGVRGIFRSTDAGASWTRVNDDAHQWGWTGAAITGDPRVYGRVYVSTNGRGVVYGDTAGTTDPGTDPGPSGACAVTYKVTGEWPGGFQADVTLKNTGTSAWNGWSLGWSFADGQKVTQAWNATVSQSGTAVTAKNVDWNGKVAPGSSVSFGFTGSRAGTANAGPAAFKLGDRSCTVG